MFRNGQWVKFDPPRPLPGAFHSILDGRVVGVHIVLSDAKGNDLPPRIAVVKENGENYTENGENVYGDLTLENLVAVTDRRDIPPARIAHESADWQPKP